MGEVRDIHVGPPIRARPRKSGDIDHRICAAEIFLVTERVVQDAQQTFRFRDVALDRIFVDNTLWGRDALKKHGLPEHRADRAHLEHEPLHGLVTQPGVCRPELAAPLGEVEQDRSRFGQHEVVIGMVDDDRNAPVRIEFEKIRGLLFIFVEVEILYVVIDAEFFKGNRGFPPVRGRGGIQGDFAHRSGPQDV